MRAVRVDLYYVQRTWRIHEGMIGASVLLSLNDDRVQRHSSPTSADAVRRMSDACEDGFAWYKCIYQGGFLGFCSGAYRHRARFIYSSIHIFIYSIIQLFNYSISLFIQYHYLLSSRYV